MSKQLGVEAEKLRRGSFFAHDRIRIHDEDHRTFDGIVDRIDARTDDDCMRLSLRRARVLSSLAAGCWAVPRCLAANAPQTNRCRGVLLSLLGSQSSAAGLLFPRGGSSEAGISLVLHEGAHLCENMLQEGVCEPLGQAEEVLEASLALAWTVLSTANVIRGCKPIDPDKSRLLDATGL